MGSGRRPKFTKAEIDYIYCLIYDYSEELDDEVKLTVSDRKMAEIINYLLQEKGAPSNVNVNEKYVERSRKVLGIKACGIRGGHRENSGCNKKLDEKAIKQIQKVLLEHTNHAEKSEEFWQLKMIDKDMADLLVQQGLDVNTKYVERMRNSLGIKPCGRQGVEVSRPSIASSQLAILHEACVNKLSYHHSSSGALLGQSGIDTHDSYGAHTLSYDEAISRKNNKLQRKPKSQPTANTYYHDNKNDIYNLKGFIIEMGLGDLYEQYSEPQKSAKSRAAKTDIFTAEVEKRMSIYGKAGRGGGVQNNKAAQSFSSM